MTQRKGNPAEPKKQRTCGYCQAPIAEQRPPYLVSGYDNRILGPFHAGCAERIVLAGKGEGVKAASDRFEQLGFWPPSREETLPW